MRRLRAVAAYDGTEFCGFQRQPGARTVQGVLETALSRLCGHPVAVTGAGRTDAGVHAVGQVVHWETSSRIPAERIGPAVNTLVGPELLVRAVEDVSPDFHARFDAVRRSYRYYVTTLWPTPFRARYVLHEPSLRPEARERMQEALLPLVGEHDFAGFCRE
ncbi:MAG: tRNA pseudouridine(38-40) synthase TruA, partial [Armatimonadetes bacterium]|nr:tRNA pseudouridine(38-40) synthase TruA [Armatimonadota bacterium]